MKWIPTATTPIPPSRVRWLGRAATTAGILLLPAILVLAWASGPTPALRPEMIWLPAGTFTMGSPRTEEVRSADEQQHTVVLTRSFALARTEVTQAMYAAVMGENPSAPQYQGVSLIGDDLPVQNLSWLDAIRYCNRLSDIDGLRAAYTIDGDTVAWNREAEGYRLPTEAEWEYAALAGTAETWSGTSVPGDVCMVGNVSDVRAKAAFPDLIETMDCDDGMAGLAPVGSYRPNAWGLFDMTGNVWEWTWDWYDDGALSEADDPIGPVSGSVRGLRGGSFISSPSGARVADRDRDSPAGHRRALGFRPARSGSPSSP